VAWETDVAAPNRGAPQVGADHVRARAPACGGQRPTTACHVARPGGGALACPRTRRAAEPWPVAGCHVAPPGRLPHDGRMDDGVMTS
jgi:hypothetical protein